MRMPSVCEWILSDYSDLVIEHVRRQVTQEQQTSKG